MTIVTADTGQSFEVVEFKREYGKPYVFSENGTDWYYAQSWKYYPTSDPSNKTEILDLLNPNMIRKSIVF
jgi:hypothetical protein